MIKKTTIILCALFLFNCSNHQNQKAVEKTENDIKRPVVIQIGKKSGNLSVQTVFDENNTAIATSTKVELDPSLTPQKINLSSIADTIIYIPLETNKECVISDIRCLRLTANDLFVLTRLGIYRFSRDGKFLNRIGNKGRGPQEYQSVGFTFAVDEKLQKVYIPDYLRKLVLCYGFDGHYEYAIKTIGNTDYTYASGYSIFYTVNKDYEGPHNSRLFKYNKKGDTLMSYSNPISIPNHPGQILMMSSGFELPLYNYSNQLYFKDFYNDTIFRVEPDGLKPWYVVDLGIMRLPVNLYPELGISMEKFRSDALKYLKSRVEETDSSLYITTTLFFEGAYNEMQFLYKKATRTTTYIHDDYKNPGFTNDLDGGRNFWPEYISENQELIAYYDMYQLKELIKENKTKPSKWLKDMIDKKNINDNPVIAVVKEKNKITH